MLSSLNRLIERYVMLCLACRAIIHIGAVSISDLLTASLQIINVSVDPPFLDPRPSFLKPQSVYIRAQRSIAGAWGRIAVSDEGKSVVCNRLATFLA